MVASSFFESHEIYVKWCVVVVFSRNFCSFWRLNNFAISLNFHPLATIVAAAAINDAPSLLLFFFFLHKIAEKFAAPLCPQFICMDAYSVVTSSIQKMDQMETLFETSKQCVCMPYISNNISMKSLSFNSFAILPYFHNYFLVCLRCVVIFVLHFCAHKKKRSFCFNCSQR